MTGFGKPVYEEGFYDRELEWKRRKLERIAITEERLEALGLNINDLVEALREHDERNPK